jgi:hypothetical protein
MARCRKISTDISVEAKLNRVSLLAALLYTWGIAHAQDDCRLPKKDPEELRMMMIPGRANSAEDVAAALAELVDGRLMGIDEDGMYFFPAEIFYKYQTYIGVKNRRETPKIKQRETARNSEKVRKSAENSKENISLASDEDRICSFINKINPQAENSEKQRESAEKCASPSPSLSKERKERGAANAPPLRARVYLSNDLGLGDRHPAALCGWELWDRLQKFWNLQGKKMTIFQVEMAYKLLSDAKHKGHDPTKIVEKTLRSGWMDLYEPNKEPLKTIPARALLAAQPVKSAQPKPSSDDIAKANQFLKNLVDSIVKEKSIPARDIDKRRELLRRQAIELRGGP